MAALWHAKLGPVVASRRLQLPQLRELVQRHVHDRPELRIPGGGPGLVVQEPEWLAASKQKALIAPGEAATTAQSELLDPCRVIQQMSAEERPQQCRRASQMLTHGVASTIGAASQDGHHDRLVLLVRVRDVARE